MHRCPNRACPSRGLETLINWVHGRGGHRGRRGAVRPAALGPRARPLDARSLPPDEGAAARAGRLRARSRRRTLSRRSPRRRSVPFWRVLFGLNIPDVGWVTAQNLARHFGSIDRLLAGDAGGRRGGRGDRPRPRRVDRRLVLRRAEPCARRGVARARPAFRAGEDERPKEGPLTGQTYVITGTLESLSREQARAALEALGAKVGDGQSTVLAGRLSRSVFHSISTWGRMEPAFCPWEHRRRESNRFARLPCRWAILHQGRRA